jgi:hypothetical protein
MNMHVQNKSTKCVNLPRLSNHVVYQKETLNDLVKSFIVYSNTPPKELSRSFPMYTYSSRLLCKKVHFYLISTKANHQQQNNKIKQLY